ncbi:hypothetical protein NHX12_010167 [Muraenolepis orangiensis]|uniref:Uncharacterized protein n=1 Tax=Muraenolepis orangiensis TaxID=630683 RepID=A0A9Q0DMK6_9TELE|nr:hypothetical protein NHX12_010167 [Muraenolepis orangiensis]
MKSLGMWRSPASASRFTHLSSGAARARAEGPHPLTPCQYVWGPHPLTSYQYAWRPHPLTPCQYVWGPHPLTPCQYVWGPHPLTPCQYAWRPHPLTPSQYVWGPHPLTPCQYVWGPHTLTSSHTLSVGLMDHILSHHVSMPGDHILSHPGDHILLHPVSTSSTTSPRHLESPTATVRAAHCEATGES